jgi:hypothetical protein
MLDRVEKGQMARFLVLVVDAIGKDWKTRTKEEMQRHVYDTGMALLDGVLSAEAEQPKVMKDA